MRITNKIMQRNNLSNINTNKVYQDKLSTQMSTQKKVSRPSDDPVVSIRALRLRSNVTGGDAVLQQEHSGCGELAGRNRGCTEEPDRDHHEYDQTVHQGI